MTRAISADSLKHKILSGEELAILDVREEGIYFDAHLLWASNAPLSRIEFLIDALVLRRSAPVVVYDSGPTGKEVLAQSAKNRLESFGYTDVSVLTGGLEGWKECGFELFSGLNVPSKTFGEYLLENRNPPEILADELNERLLRSDDLVVLDSRPMDEYSVMSIPTAIDVPGGELVYRVFEVAPNPATDVVVNCAGRTRSIIGAQSLINAGIPNRVMLLKDGTMGWHLAGLKLDHGADRTASAPTAERYGKALSASGKVATQFGVRPVDLKTLSNWQADPDRTLYVFDVRTAEEFEAGHLPGARHAPGGQLVQTTDEFVAIRNARIVLVDDKLVRANMTASWLIQMGYKNVYVLDDSLQSVDLESGMAGPNIMGFREFDTLNPGELHAVLQSGEPAMVVDLSVSNNYKLRHIPKAAWCIRQRLDNAMTFRPPVGLLVLTSEDGKLAHLAAHDLVNSNYRGIVRVLEGGNQGWENAGYALVDGMEDAMCEVDDIWERPYDRALNQEQRMQQYLEWEVQLMRQAERDGTTEFRCE